MLWRSKCFYRFSKVLPRGGRGPTFKACGDFRARFGTARLFPIASQLADKSGQLQMIEQLRGNFGYTLAR